MDRTQNMRLQLLRPGWDGVSNPDATFIIDDITLPAIPAATPARSWQLGSTASLSELAATLNDDASSWCQSPEFPEISYATGHYGTPTGGGGGGTQGLPNGVNLSCD